MDQKKSKPKKSAHYSRIRIVSKYVLREIEGQSGVQSLPIVGPEKGKVLEHLVKKYRPNRILEIGTLVGYSAILMGQHLGHGKLVTLEIDHSMVEIARKNIEHAGLSNRIDVVVGDARKTIKLVRGKFDMVFIDGTKDEYLSYLKLAENKMNKKSIVVADNVKVFAGSMQDYLNYVRKSGRYISKYYDFGSDGVEVSMRVWK